MRQRSAKSSFLRGSPFLECLNQGLSTDLSLMRQDRVLGCVLAGPCEFSMTQALSRCNGLVPVNFVRVEENESGAHDSLRGFSRRQRVLDDGIESSKQCSIQQSRMIGGRDENAFGSIL